MTAASASDLLTELDSIFKVEMDGSTLFDANVKPKHGKNSLKLTVVVAIAILTLSLIVFKNHWYPNQVTKAENQVLDSKLDNMERAYTKTTRKKNKQAQARDIVSALLAQNELQTRAGDHAAAEKSLDKALSYCDTADTGKHICRATVLLRKAQDAVRANKNDAAEAMLTQALALNTKRGIKPKIALERATIRIRSHNFAGANSDVQTLITSTYQQNELEQEGETYFSGKPTFGDAVKLIANVENELNKQKLSSPAESAAALRIYDQIGQLYLKQAYDKTKTVTTKISELADDITPSDTDLSQLKANSYRLLSAYALQAGNKAEASFYRKKAEQ